MDHKPKVLLILQNIRSAHNVGAMFRTADGAGVDQIILSGYTPTPPKGDAPYLTSADKALHKTALGAERLVPWKQVVSLSRFISRLHKEGYQVVALEQSPGSIEYRCYRARSPLALIVGNEVQGVEAGILKRCDAILEIPMRGSKNSLNVSVATGIALYQIMSTMKE